MFLDCFVVYDFLCHIDEEIFSQSMRYDQASKLKKPENRVLSYGARMNDRFFESANTFFGRWMGSEQCGQFFFMQRIDYE